MDAEWPRVKRVVSAMGFVEAVIGFGLALLFLGMADPIEPEDMAASAMFLALFAVIPLGAAIGARYAAHRITRTIPFVVVFLWPLALGYAIQNA